MTSLTLDHTITDSLVVSFGRVSAEIQIAITDAEPGSLLHRGLLDRLDQVERAWNAFHSNPSWLGAAP